MQPPTPTPAFFPSKCFYPSCLCLVISIISPTSVCSQCCRWMLLSSAKVSSSSPPPALGGEEAGSIAFAHAADILDSTCCRETKKERKKQKTTLWLRLWGFSGCSTQTRYWWRLEVTFFFCLLSVTWCWVAAALYSSLQVQPQKIKTKTKLRDKIEGLKNEQKNHNYAFLKKKQQKNIRRTSLKKKGHLFVLLLQTQSSIMLLQIIIVLLKCGKGKEKKDKSFVWNKNNVVFCECVGQRSWI